MSNLATIVNNILADSGIDDINVVVTTGSYANPAWITSLAWTKITGAPANIVTGTGAAGQVAFFNGTNSIASEINLLWDGSNNRLGIGVTPTQALDVVGKIKATDDLILAQQNPAITFDNGTSGTLRIFSSFAAAAIATFNSTGGFRLNSYGTGAITGTRAYDLAVDASGNVIEVAVGAGTITGGGTAGQVSYFNGSSSITSDANFTWNSSTETLAVEENISSYRRYNLYFNDNRNLSAQLYEDGASTNGGTLTLYGKASGTVDTVISAAPTKLNYINNAANLMIGWNTDQFYKLAVNGDFYAALDARVGGNLGVGAAPISGISLYIKGNGVDSPLLKMQGFANTTAMIGDTTTGTTDVGNLWLYNQGVLKVRFDAGDVSYVLGGNFGVGTATPSAKLVVSGSGDLSYIYNSGVSTTDANFYIYNSTTDIFMVRNSGNVGIGTTNLPFKLNIESTSEAAARIKSTNASGAARLILNPEGAGAGSTGDASIMFDCNSSAWVAGVDKSDASRFKIAADPYADFRAGVHLSIDNVTDRSNVVIGGTTAVNSTAGRGNLTINGSSTAIMNFTVGSSERAYLYHNNTTMQLYNVADGDIEVGANNTLIATFKAATSGQRNLVVGGTTALSTSANRANITINGANNSILAFGVSNVLKGYLYNNGTSFFMNMGAGDMIFEGNIATPLYLNQNGFVGIRTTPLYQLSVNGSNNGIDFETNTTSTYARSIFFTTRETGVAREIGTTGGYSYGPSNPLTMVLTQTSDTPIAMFRASDDAVGAGLKGYKSRGTVALPVSVNNGDTIFSVEGWAFHGSGPNNAKFGAGMRFVKDDGFGTANTYAPQRIEFYNANTTTSLQTNMAIFPNGNTTIGTATYYGSYKLYVEGIVASNSGFLINSGQYNSAADVPYTGIFMTGSSSSDGFGALLISSRTDTSRPIVFGTYNGSALGERARITGVGEFWLGYTSDQGAYLLQVNGSTYSASGFFESSDIRLKTILNRHHSVDFDAIEYNWNDGRDSKLHWGYAAQEVMKFLPDAVSGSEELFYTLDYNQVHTYKIAMLEKRIAELESQLKNK